MNYHPKGNIHLTGEPDSGKTIAAITAYHPKNTAYLFDDVKKPEIDESEFGLFIDLVAKYSKLKMLEYYEAVRKEIDGIKQMDCIVFDTWTRFGKAIRYYAKSNPFEFREAFTFSKNGTIKNMEQWSETHRVEADIVSLLSQKCKALFLITHIKPQLIAGVRTGSFEPDCGRSFSKVCNMRLWLRHNPHSGVPIALVLKRISKLQMTDNGISPINVLPRRIVPLSDHTSIWDSIGHYWDNPVSNREAVESEIPTPFELSILDGILTDEQKEMWRAEITAKERQEREEDFLFDAEYEEVKEKVKQLASNGKVPPLILAEIEKNYEGYTLPQIVKMMEEQ